MSLVGELSVNAASAAELNLRGENATTQVVAGAGTTDATITMPTYTSTIMSNPARGSVVVEKDQDDNSAQLDIGSAAAADGGQLSVHAAAENDTIFHVDEDAVVSGRPLQFGFGLKQYRFVASEAGNFKLEFSRDSGVTWQTITEWTEPPAE